MSSLQFPNGEEIFRRASGSTLTVAVTGDICPARVPVNGPRPEDAERILGIFKPIFDRADLKICQWETPLTDHADPIDKSGPNLIAPSAYATYLTSPGFDVALLANNHTGDQNSAALLETMTRLDNLGIAHVGAGVNEEDAKRVLFRQINGFTVAILNGCEHEFGTATHDKPGSNAINVGEFCVAIADARKKADIVLVILHGGNETNPVPSPRMTRMCRAFADSGASAVINIHTHCPQGIELYHDVPIVYCPGNFFFPWPIEKYDTQNFWWIGYLPVFTFDAKGAVKLEIHPYRLSPEPWKMELFSGEAKRKFCTYIGEISRPLSDPKELLKLFDAWCFRMGGMFGTLAQHCPRLELREMSREEVCAILCVRNLFTCEAHHEVVANSLRLLENHISAADPAALEQIEKWRTAAF